MSDELPRAPIPSAHDIAREVAAELSGQHAAVTVPPAVDRLLGKAVRKALSAILWGALSVLGGFVGTAIWHWLQHKVP